MVYVNDTIVRTILIYIFNMTTKKRMRKLHSNTREQIQSVSILFCGTTEKSIYGV